MVPVVIQIANIHMSCQQMELPEMETLVLPQLVQNSPVHFCRNLGTVDSVLHVNSPTTSLYLLRTKTLPVGCPCIADGANSSVAYGGIQEEDMMLELCLSSPLISRQTKWKSS